MPRRTGNHGYSAIGSPKRFARKNCRRPQLKLRWPVNIKFLLTQIVTLWQFEYDKLPKTTIGEPTGSSTFFKFLNLQNQLWVWILPAVIFRLSGT